MCGSLGKMVRKHFRLRCERVHLLSCFCVKAMHTDAHKCAPDSSIVTRLPEWCPSEIMDHNYQYP